MLKVLKRVVYFTVLVFHIITRMWPSRKSKGVTLQYGHDGAAIYTPNINPQSPWQFARRHGLGYNFISTGSYRSFYDPNAGANDSYSLDYEKFKYSAKGDYFPHSIHVDAMADQDMFKSKVTEYDPLVGSLMSIGSIRENRAADVDDDDDDDDDDDEASRQVVALGVDYTLQLGYLDTTDRQFKDAENDIVSASVPDIHFTNSHTTSSPIRQVEFAEPEPDANRHMLVRTTSATSILSVVSEDNHINVNELLDIPFLGRDRKQNRQATYHACATFSPWSYSQAAVVNSQGVWGLYDLESAGRPVLSPDIVSSSIFDYRIQTFSRWNQIIWGADPTSILTANRRYIQLYDTRAPTSSNTLFSYPNGEETMCGISRSKLNDYYMFVLDSEALRWVDMRKPGDVVLSWDHFMNKSDPTIKLSNCAVDDQIDLICVYSQTNHANLLFQFTETGGLPVSAEDPVCIVGPPDKISQSLVLVPVEVEEEVSMLSILRFSTESAFESEIIASKELSEVRELSEARELGEASEPNEMSELSEVNEPNEISTPVESNEPNEFNELDELNASSSNDIYRNDYILNPKIEEKVLFNFEYMYDFLFENTTQMPQFSDKDEDMEKFATHLGHKINDFVRSDDRSVKTLLELSELDESDIMCTNIEELSALLEQLKLHYSKTKVKIYDLTNNLHTIFDNDQVSQNIEESYNYLLSLWVEPLNKDLINSNAWDEIISRRKRYALYIAIKLTLSCIGVHVDREEKGTYTDPLYKYMDKKKINKSVVKANTRALLDDWDLGHDPSEYKWYALGTKPREERREVEVVDRYQQIQESQAESQSQLLSQSQSQSQSQSSQSHKKKKSRKSDISSQKKHKKKKTEGFG